MPYKDKDKLRQSRYEYSVRNKDKKIAVTRENRDSKKRFLAGVKSYPCLDCGQFWPPCAMELDHLDATTKVQRVSAMVKIAGWDRLIQEVMKCDLVCACCHAIRTADRHKSS